MNFEKELNELRNELIQAGSLDSNFYSYEQYVFSLDSDDLCMCFDSFLSCKK